jgi:hypothetical protein
MPDGVAAAYPTKTLDVAVLRKLTGQTARLSDHARAASSPVAAITVDS